VVDIGPEGGDNGGRVVFEGIPEDLIKEKNSYTGEFLKERFAAPGTPREKHFDWIVK
jgi:excinuclease ABC subunit A